MPSLPANSEDGHSSPNPSTPAPSETPDFYSARILIVDDEQMNVLLLKALLRQAGYKCLVCTTDPLEVASICQEAAPDLVLLDIMMPHRNGFEILEDLKDLRERNFMPVMMLTADTRHETRVRALTSGASAFQTKPLVITDVLDLVHHLLEQAHWKREAAAQKRQA